MFELVLVELGEDESALDEDDCPYHHRSCIQNNYHPQKYSLLAHYHQDMSPQNFVQIRRIMLEVVVFFS